MLCFITKLSARFVSLRNTSSSSVVLLCLRVFHCRLQTWCKIKSRTQLFEITYYFVQLYLRKKVYAGVSRGL